MDKQLRIGIFNDSFPPVMDGVAMVTLNYAWWLKDRGEDVRVITPYVPDAEPFIAKMTYPVMQYSSIPVLVRKPYRAGVPQVAFKFQREFNQLTFDIVHTHCPFSSAHLALRAAKRQNIPFVASFHTKYREDFVRGTHSERIADMMIRRIIKLYEQADAVWIPQAAVEETLREYGYKGEVTVVDNGNDFVTPVDQIAVMRKEMRKELGVRDNELMFLYVGQHIWEKNWALMLDALKEIRELPFRFFTCGSGYAMKDIEAKVAEYGLQDKVTFLGVVKDRERLKKIQAAADLFLFPSLYDTSPLTIREAAAMHTPSVMIAGSTTAEVITADGNGFLAENTPEAYSKQLKLLIEHPELIEPVANNAASTLTRSWEDVMDEVRMRYRDIIQCKKRNTAK